MEKTINWDEAKQQQHSRDTLLHSRTCIKRHRIKLSPCIKRWIVKVPKLFPLIHCNFPLCWAVTSIKRSPFIDIRRPSKHQHPRWNYSANSKRQKIEFTIQILPIFLPSVFRFNWVLSLALSRSGYVYFKRNLLLAYDDSTVFLENEMCKQVDSWWASVKRKISGLSHAFARDDAANHPEKAKDVNQNLILSKASSSSSEREVFHAFHIASKSIETLNCCISLSVIVGTLRFVDFSKVLKRLIWTYMIFFLMLNLSSDVISINSCKFRFWVQW